LDEGAEETVDGTLDFAVFLGAIVVDCVRVAKWEAETLGLEG